VILNVLITGVNGSIADERYEVGNGANFLSLPVVTRIRLGSFDGQEVIVRIVGSRCRPFRFARGCYVSCGKSLSSGEGVRAIHRAIKRGAL